MALKVFQVDTVVVGRFNPYIITPDWVKTEEIVEAEKVELSFGISGRDVVFQFNTQQFRWHVDYGRLVVASDDVSADPGAKVALVVEKLPHTPITAVGNNFHYRSSARDWSAGLPSLGKSLDFRALGSQGKVLEVSWGFKVEKDVGLVLGVTVEQSEEHIQVNANFHRVVKDKDQAIIAAKQFSEDRKASKDILASLIGQKVEE